MARLGALFLVFFLVSASHLSSTEASSRKLLTTPCVKQEKDNENPNANSIEKRTGLPSFSSLFLSALPKGKVPSSSPSKKGHATLENQRLFERHLARIDRVLRSVPSPGAGH